MQKVTVFGHVAPVTDTINAYRITKTFGKLLLRRLRRSFDYNINIAVREITVRIVIGLNWFGFSGGFWY
jgi:hypothetical protein